jgi:hypothetical protein
MLGAITPRPIHLPVLACYKVESSLMSLLEIKIKSQPIGLVVMCVSKGS